MNEQEWLAATDPAPMLEFLGGRATERKCRLFAVACCRLVPRLFPDHRHQEAVRVAERLADGGVEEAERLAVEVAAAAAAAEDPDVSDINTHLRTPERLVGVHYDSVRASWDATGIVYAAVLEFDTTFDSPLFPGVGGSMEGFLDLVRRSGLQLFDGSRAELRATQANILREVFGNPFRAVAFDPSWRTDAARSLAQGMYQSRDFALAPVLADSLEDAGCIDAEVLGHLRGGEGHVKGCWCVDGVLGLS